MNDKVLACEFCVTPHSDLLFDEIGVDEKGIPVNIHVDVDGQNIRFYDDYCSIIVTRKINYCPNCGRRLNGGATERH